jgi:acyl carrier protein
MSLQEHIAEASVRETVAQFIGQDLGKVSETADFSEDLGMDSLDRLELMAAIEKEYDVLLSDEELSSVSNMRELIQALAVAEVGAVAVTGAGAAAPAGRLQ